MKRYLVLSGLGLRSDRESGEHPVTGRLPGLWLSFNTTCSGATVKSYIATVLMPYHSGRYPTKITVQAADYLSARSQLEAVYGQANVLVVVEVR